MTHLKSLPPGLLSLAPRPLLGYELKMEESRDQSNSTRTETGLTAMSSLTIAMPWPQSRNDIWRNQRLEVSFASFKKTSMLSNCVTDTRLSTCFTTATTTT